MTDHKTDQTDQNATLKIAQERQAEELLSLFKSFDKAHSDQSTSAPSATPSTTPASTSPDPVHPPAASVKDTSQLVPAGPVAAETPIKTATPAPTPVPSEPPAEATPTPSMSTPNVPSAPADMPESWAEVINDNALNIPADLLTRLMEAASLVPEPPSRPAPNSPAAPAQSIPPATPTAPTAELRPVNPALQPQQAPQVPQAPQPTSPAIDISPPPPPTAPPTPPVELPRVELQWDEPVPQIILPEIERLPDLSASESVPEKPKPSSGSSHGSVRVDVTPTQTPAPIQTSVQTPAPTPTSVQTPAPTQTPHMPQNTQPTDFTSEPSELSNTEVDDGIDTKGGPPFLLPMYPSAMPFLGRFLPQSSPTHMGLNQAHTDLHKFLQHMQELSWNGYLHVALGDQSAYALLFEGRIVGAAVAHAVNEEALGELMNLYDQGGNLSAHPLSTNYAHILSGVGSRAWKLAPTEEFTGIYAKPAGAAFYMEGQVIAVTSVSLPYEGSFPATLRPKTISLPRSHARWAHQQYVLTLKGKDALNPITDINMDFRTRFGDKGLRLLRAISQGMMPVDYASRSDLVLHELEPMVHAWLKSGYMRDRDDL